MYMKIKYFVHTITQTPTEREAERERVRRREGDLAAKSSTKASARKWRMKAQLFGHFIDIHKSTKKINCIYSETTIRLQYQDCKMMLMFIENVILIVAQWKKGTNELGE